LVEIESETGCNGEGNAY